MFVCGPVGAGAVVSGVAAGGGAAVSGARDGGVASGCNLQRGEHGIDV